jgi:uncharacterized membrane protein
MKLLLLLAILFVVSCSLPPSKKSEAENYFLTEVKPVLQQQCLRCHNGGMPAPALNLTSRAAAFKRNAAGLDYIVPGAPDRSHLITAVQRKGTHPKLMPRADISLTDDQIGMLREWITDGAFWPKGEAGELRPQSSGEHP